MNQNKDDIRELRSMLFSTIRELRSGDKKMDLARARTIHETAQVIINSAKVEVDFIHAIGDNSTGSGFIPLTAPEQDSETPQGDRPSSAGGKITHPKPGVTKHTL